MAGNWTAPNPPFGAVFTFSLRQDPPGDAKLVMTITDESGKQIRRFDVDKGTGLRRVAWNLRADPPPPSRAGGAGEAGRAGGAGEAGRAGGAGGGRGGPPQGPLVAPGRYHAQLGRQSGTEVTPLGQAQEFSGRAVGAIRLYLATLATSAAIASSRVPLPSRYGFQVSSSAGLNRSEAALPHTGRLRVRHVSGHDAFHRVARGKENHGVGQVRR